MEINQDLMEAGEILLKNSLNLCNLAQICDRTGVSLTALQRLLQPLC